MTPFTIHLSLISQNTSYFISKISISLKAFCNEIYGKLTKIVDSFCIIIVIFSYIFFYCSFLTFQCAQNYIFQIAKLNIEECKLLAYSYNAVTIFPSIFQIRQFINYCTIITIDAYISKKNISIQKFTPEIFILIYIAGLWMYLTCFVFYIII